MMTLSAYNLFFFFFFNDTATTEIYTLSLHDALPISRSRRRSWARSSGSSPSNSRVSRSCRDRKSTRLNSSHLVISYAVFCLKKKKLHISPPTAHTPLPLAQQSHLVQTAGRSRMQTSH